MNGAYRDDSDIGKLMHDFCCWNASEMNFDLMKQATRYYKETQEGVEYMCRAFEETRKQGFERGMQQGLQQGMQQGMQQGLQQGIDSERIRLIKLLMNNPATGQHMSADQAMTILSIPVEEQPRYLKML